MTDDIVYSKVILYDKDDEPILYQKKNKHKKKMSLIQHIKENENVQSKINELKNVDPKKAEEAYLEYKWENAFKRLNGEKVKDDNVLIKKTIQNQRYLKRAKARKWAEREEGVKLIQQKKRDKIKANVEKKKEMKLKKRIKKNTKKGHIVYGLINLLLYGLQNNAKIKFYGHVDNVSRFNCSIDVDNRTDITW